MGKIIDLDETGITVFVGTVISLIAWLLSMFFFGYLTDNDINLVNKAIIYSEFEEYGEIVINPKTGDKEWKWYDQK